MKPEILCPVVFVGKSNGAAVGKMDLFKKLHRQLPTLGFRRETEGEVWIRSCPGGQRKTALSRVT